jgi:hypothetical protein
MLPLVAAAAAAAAAAAFCRPPPTAAGGCGERFRGRVQVQSATFIKMINYGCNGWRNYDDIRPAPPRGA